VPKGTKKDVIARLNAAITAALVDPDVKQRLGQLGHEIPTQNLLTPPALGVLQRHEISKWWPIIKAAGIKAE
jgi:tripartite-type tricarboxylate transporter receptor subunit TctC